MTALRVTALQDENFCAVPFPRTGAGALFCVFDGHAGRECAVAARELFPQVLNIETCLYMVYTVASRVVHLTCEQVFEKRISDWDGGDMKDLFTVVFEVSCFIPFPATLDHEVPQEVDEGLKYFECEGSTATAVYVWAAGGKRFLQAANVGDSTAFLWYSLSLCLCIQNAADQSLSLFLSLFPVSHLSICPCPYS